MLDAMRITVRLDEDLLREVKRLAAGEQIRRKPWSEEHSCAARPVPPA